MNMLDIYHSNIKTLKELTCNRDLNDASNQLPLLDYLTSLFSNESIDQNFFIWPSVERLFTQFFASLDQNLEFEAGKVFHLGRFYIARCMVSLRFYETQQVVYRLLVQLKKRFPCL